MWGYGNDSRRYGPFVFRPPVADSEGEFAFCPFSELLAPLSDPGSPCYPTAGCIGSSPQAMIAWSTRSEPTPDRAALAPGLAFDGQPSCDQQASELTTSPPARVESFR